MLKITLTLKYLPCAHTDPSSMADMSGPPHEGLGWLVLQFNQRLSEFPCWGLLRGEKESKPITTVAATHNTRSYILVPNQSVFSFFVKYYFVC